MAVTKESIKRVGIFAGRVWLRAQLFGAALVSAVIAIGFIPIPADGPFGELSFGTLSIFLFLAAIRGPPKLSEVKEFVKDGRATQSALLLLRKRR